MATPTRRSPLSPPDPLPSDQVNLRWLLSALAYALLAAAVLAYLAVCLLVIMGSRQMILHPSKTVDITPAAIPIPFEPIRFDAAATGTPRLTAWWIPATAPTSRTILLLHDAHGSLASTIFVLAPLHQANVNILAVDYRGFGQSDPTFKSTQASMAEDTAAALNYLTETRHIAPAEIVPYGVGLATALAAQLALQRPALRAVIIDNPDLSTVSAVLDDPRARLLPMRFLVKNRFELAAPLSALTRPRMLIVCGPGQALEENPRKITSFYNSVPSPKFTLTLPTEAPEPSRRSKMEPHCSNTIGPEYIAAITRFLDENLPAPIQILQTPQPQRTQP